MADLMQFDLVSPERRLASVEAKAVQIPGADGDLTAMPNHAPLITTLRPGLLTVETGGGETMQYVVTGGFADISGPATTVLAERAVPKADLTTELVQQMVEDARNAHAQATESGLANAADAAAKLLADMEALHGHIGG